MNRNRLTVVLIVVVMLMVVLVVHAGSGKKALPVKADPQPISEIKLAPTSAPQTSTPTISRQGYRLVTDVLDSFGGESESDNYRIPVNSGGQSSAIGISQSTIYVVKAGFVLASDVKHGDANSDGAIGAGDIVFLLNYLFRDEDEPCPMEAGDANCSGAVEAGDIVYLISYLYRGGPPPAC
jgi:hypothetical protein